MENIQQIRKAFREAIIADEQMLSQGKITWDEHEARMRDFELALREMGEDL